jgi:hypothetical protein
MGVGAGELAATALGGPLRISTSPSTALLAVVLLTSLLTGTASSGLSSLDSGFSLVLFSAETVADSSDAGWEADLGGAVQRGISQTTPVKLLSLNPPLFHLRQGAPERSRARRPALMAPWLALGPSLWAALALALGSIVPSSL